jgi:uncharacterized membrane protein
MSNESLSLPPSGGKKPRPFRRAVLRGLAIVLPPLLTIVLFLWAWNTIRVYVLVPVEAGARHMLVWSVRDVLQNAPPEARINPPRTDASGIAYPATLTHQGTLYVAVPSAQSRSAWIPQEVYDFVQQRPGEQPLTSADAYYHRYVDRLWLPQYIVVPVFLSIFILVLYVVGKFVTAPLGYLLWNVVEALIHRLPLISNVYGSVKQVTDFMLNEQQVRFNRVVAIEYPRKGIWSVGFVTGDGMKNVADFAEEPVVSVLVPTSPMPATGFTVLVAKREIIDLNITLDQAIQYIVSCGVVVAHHQLPARNAITAKISSGAAKQAETGE